MKWYEMDSYADLDPKIVEVIAHFEELGKANGLDGQGNRAVGALWRTWQFVARCSKLEGRSRLGWSIDSKGRPYPTRDLARNCGESVPVFEALMDKCAEVNHIDRSIWRSRKIIVLPAMIKRADAFTKRKVRELQQDSGVDQPDDRRSESGQGAATSQHHTLQNQPDKNRDVKPSRRKRKIDLEPSSLFLEFWSALPSTMKVARQEALLAWDQLGIDRQLDGPELVRATMIPAIVRQVAAKRWDRPDNFNPHPATWLRNKRWRDEVVSPKPPTAPSGAGGHGATGAPTSTKSAAYASLAAGDDEASS